jgi:hypothetical protein
LHLVGTSRFWNRSGVHGLAKSLKVLMRRLLGSVRKGLPKRCGRNFGVLGTGISSALNLAMVKCKRCFGL